jgi:hypothetical protein
MEWLACGFSLCARYTISMEERRPKLELASALGIECLKPDLYSSAHINGFVLGHKSNIPSCLHVHYLASLKAK